MPANAVSETRAALANAFSALSANVYPSVPEAPIPPAIVVVPDSPYMEVVLIGKSKTQVKINFAITAIVASNSNAGSLDNLEKLIIGILAVSVEVFQSRVAAGGQIEGIDFASTPYRMGRSLTNRVSTLLMPYLDVETVVQ